MTTQPERHILDAMDSYWATQTNREYMPVRLTPREIIEVFGVEVAKEKLKEYREDLERFDRIEMKLATYLFQQHRTEDEVIATCDLLNFDWERHWTKEQIERLEDLIKTAKYEPKEGEIGPEEIQRAKAVPITNYIDFNRANMACCLWHNERTGSMHYYKQSNRIKCFGCDKSADVIDVVMKLQGMEFINAVKYILGR